MRHVPQWFKPAFSAVGIEARPLDTGQLGELTVPAGEVVRIKLIQVVVSAGAGHDLHQFGGGIKESREAPGSDIDFELFTQLRFLGGDPCRAEICIADAGSHAADGLHGGVGNGHAVGSKGEGLDKISMNPQAASDNQGHPPAGTRFIEEVPGAGQCGNGGDGNVVPEEGGSRTGTTPSSVEDDIVGSGLQGKFHVALNVLGTQLESDRNTAGNVSNPIAESAGARVRLHICGQTRHLWNGIASLNVDIIDVDWMVPLSEMRALLGPRVVLAGNLDPVKDIRFGEPSAIRAGVARCRAEAGDPFMVCAGCEIPSGTPGKNMRALCAPICFEQTRF